MLNALQNDRQGSGASLYWTGGPGAADHGHVEQDSDLEGQHPEEWGEAGKVTERNQLPSQCLKRLYFKLSIYIFTQLLNRLVSMLIWSKKRQMWHCSLWSGGNPGTSRHLSELFIITFQLLTCLTVLSILKQCRFMLISKSYIWGS